MGIAQLFFRKENKIDTIELDIIIRESATAVARLTENPVENGANINDHIIIEPMTFTVEGVVSNISSSFAGQFTRIPQTFTKGNTKAQEAWKELLELQVSRVPFTLVQGLKEYKNIVILSLSESQDKDTSNGLFFSATMKEIVFVGGLVTTEEQINDDDTTLKMLPTITGGLKNLVGL